MITAFVSTMRTQAGSLQMGGLPHLVVAQAFAFTHGEETEAANDATDETGALEILQDMDKDNDGVLTLAEIMPIDEPETTEDEKKMMQKAFDHSDKNRDGKIQVSEVLGAMEEFTNMGEI